MNRIVVILLNIGYWLMFLLLLFMFFLLIGATQKHKNLDTWNFFWEFATVMLSMAVVPGAIGFYGAYGWLFPKYLAKRNIKGFITGILAILPAAIVSGVLVMGVISLANEKRIEFSVYMIFMAIPIGFMTLVNMAIGLVMRGFITSYADIKLKEELNRKNYEMELALIKAQIDPHFLFNTINNIDILIEVNAQKASEYLKKLSDIMRFMLYETKTDLVSLEMELSYLKKYIELQKIRSSNEQYVNFDFSGNTESWQLQPMLFMPFLENAFKHATNKRQDNAIDVRITAGDQLHFSCSNKFDETDRGELTAGGLGIELICKRLELIYPGKHQLTIAKKDGTFHVDLYIQK